MIEVTLLGTSALLPLPERGLTAATLTCSGRTILFDCGEGTQAAARKAHVSLMKTDLIALTHYHGDHIFGLPGLLQTMFCLGRTEPLWMVGPQGLREELAPILQLTGWTPYPIHLLELPEEGVALSQLAPDWPEGAWLRAYPTVHRVPSQAYAFTLARAGKFLPQRAETLGVPRNLWGRLQKGEGVQVDGGNILPEQVLGQPRKGLKVVFTGDTTLCDGLLEAEKDADLVISEATYGENEQKSLAIEHGHMNFAQAGETAALAGAKRLWLTHYSQMIDDPETYLPNAQAYFPAAECGVDGKSVTLRFEREE